MTPVLVPPTTSNWSSRTKQRLVEEANEISYEVKASQLTGPGILPGDPEWERLKRLIAAIQYLHRRLNR